jgi:nitroreductase
MFRALKNIFLLLTGAASVPRDAGPALRLILNRRSCRSFRSEMLTDAQLATVLEAGRYAPSTVNLQTWSFITFSAAQWRTAFGRPLPFQGAAAIIICADIHRLKTVLPDLHGTPHVNLCLAVFNAGLAAMNMTLAAEALGLRSIMLSDTGRTGLLDYTFLRDALDLPEGVIPLTTLVVGHAGPPGIGIPPRLPSNMVVMNQRYSEGSQAALHAWMGQMRTGYALTHRAGDFAQQLACYRAKMTEAEAAVRRQFAHRNGDVQ